MIDDPKTVNQVKDGIKKACLETLKRQTQHVHARLLPRPTKAIFGKKVSPPRAGDFESQ